MLKNTLTLQEVNLRKKNVSLILIMSRYLAIIASQIRLVQIMEKLYGENAASNPALMEYKRAVEALEHDTKENLV